MRHEIYEWGTRHETSRKLKKRRRGVRKMIERGVIVVVERGIRMASTRWLPQA
jgi:hypothetical protein